MHFRSCALVVLALASGGPVLAQYKCVDGSGRTTFQQAPCSGGAPIDSRPQNVVSGDRGAVVRAERSRAVQALMESGRVVPGMTEAEARNALGVPAVVNTDVIGGSVRKQHVYRFQTGDVYVYTQDGRVTAVQDRPMEPSRHVSTEPCYSDQEIKNAWTSASSITLDKEQRRRLEDRARAMRRCQ